MGSARDPGGSGWLRPAVTRGGRVTCQRSGRSAAVQPPVSRPGSGRGQLTAVSCQAMSRARHCSQSAPHLTAAIHPSSEAVADGEHLDRVCQTAPDPGSMAPSSPYSGLQLSISSPTRPSAISVYHPFCLLTESLNHSLLRLSFLLFNSSSHLFSYLFPLAVPLYFPFLFHSCCSPCCYPSSSVSSHQSHILSCYQLIYPTVPPISFFSTSVFPFSLPFLVLVPFPSTPRCG